MLVQNSVYRNTYLTDGVNKDFYFSFPILESSQVLVQTSLLTNTDVVTTIDPSQYTVTGVGLTTGGHISFTTAPPTGSRIALTLNIPITQLYQYAELDSFPAKSHEDALAKLTLICQQLKEQLERAVRLPPTSNESPEDVVASIYAGRDEAQAASGAAQAAKAEAGQSAAQAAASAAGASAAVAAATATAVTTATAQADRAQSAANAAQAAAGAAADDARQAVAAEIGKASSEADRAQSEADRAQMEANRAQSLADVGPADADKLGFVKIGKGIDVEEDGTISVTPIDVATPEKAGIVKPGTGTIITGEGELSVSYWDAFPPYVPIPVWGVKFGGSDGRRAIMPGETSAREDWILCDGGSDGKSGSMPGLQGKFIQGVPSGGAVGTGGSATHTHTVSGSVGATTLSVEQLASHGHYYNGSYARYLVSYGGEGLIFHQTGDTTGAAGSNASHTHSISSASTTSGSNLPPYQSINYVMRVI